MKSHTHVYMVHTYYVTTQENLFNVLIPSIYFLQSVEIPDDSATTLRDKLYGTVRTVNLLTHIGIIVGSVLIVLSLLCFFLCSSSNTAQNGESKIGKRNIFLVT